MNVFVLNTGRCGSTTFIKACQHIDNYTAGHESRARHTGPDRLSYPEHHIEADNRLSWFLGRLEQHYGDNAFYIHLARNTEDTVASFTRRSGFGIMKAYRKGIYMTKHTDNMEQYARDYVDTVNANIRHFMKDKTHTMDFQLEQAKQHFWDFWQEISATGDRDAALDEWDTVYNKYQKKL